MTVKELIELLSKFDQYKVVVDFEGREIMDVDSWKEYGVMVS